LARELGVPALAARPIKASALKSVELLGGNNLRLKKLPAMNKAEVEQLLKEQILCRIAFGGKNAPYIAPFQYALVNGQLYFHFTQYGKKMGLLEEGNSVCVEIEKYTQDLSDYSFVVLTGRLQIVTDHNERARAIRKMVETAKTKRLSENFLVAHGFPAEKGWSYLNPEKPIVIVKLERVTDQVGLKSP
jgi:nitroimidazol reductase NimA-like FMN-containing flavoprotein (pyridoxamine 5'-phosphate oxidase superfamily)